jgi:hypothetical protein
VVEVISMGGLVVVVVKFKNRLEIWQSFVMDVCVCRRRKREAKSEKSRSLYEILLVSALIVVVGP